MKYYKGFSLAEILQTIFVVGIIAGISLGFFRHHEPDKRIYESTVKQLEFAVAAITHKACSNEYMCFGEGANAGKTEAVSCPDDISFQNNKCERAKNSDGSCAPGWTANITDTKCIATPRCKTYTLTTYKDKFCPDMTPNLNTEVKFTDSGNDYSTTFFCSQMFDLLSHKSDDDKVKICSDTANTPLHLPNRVRLYGLSSLGTGSGMKTSGVDPAYIVIKYDNPKNPLFSNEDLASLSEDTAGAVFVYPNGWLVSTEKYLDKGGQSGYFTSDDYFNSALIFTGSYNGKSRDTVLNDVKGKCGDKGINCSPATGNNIFKQFDSGIQAGSAPSN